MQKKFAIYTKKQLCFSLEKLFHVIIEANSKNKNLKTENNGTLYDNNCF
jgi:hypothetical protein